MAFYGAIFHAHAARGHLGELPVRLVVEILGHVLGRGVQHREGLQIVQHLVVDAVDDRAQHLLEQLEVQQQAGLVQLRAARVTRTL